METQHKAMTGSAVATLVALNNKGVDLFNENQDIHSASKYFRVALRIVEKLVKEDGDAKKSGSGSGAAVRFTKIHRSRKSINRLSLSQSSMVSETPQGRTGLPSQQGSRLETVLQLSSQFISTVPVKLLAKPGNEHADILSGILSVSISFNLALTKHLLGYIVAPEKASKYFHSAIELYGIAYALRLRTPDKRGFRGELFGLTDLAIVNNLGVLYNQLGRSRRSHVCFRKLAEVICRLDASKLKEASGFLGNLVLVGPERDSLPAAAA